MSPKYDFQRHGLLLTHAKVFSEGNANRSFLSWLRDSSPSSPKRPSYFDSYLKLITMTAKIAEEHAASFITGQDDILSQTDDETEDARDIADVSVPEAQGGTPTDTDERDVLSSEGRMEERKKKNANMRKYVAKSRISSNPNKECIAKSRRQNQEHENKRSSAKSPTSPARLKMANFISAVDRIDYADKLASAESKMGFAPTPSSSSQRTRTVHYASSVSSCSTCSTPNQEYKNKRTSAATPPTSPTRLKMSNFVSAVDGIEKQRAESKKVSPLPQFSSERTSIADNTSNAKTKIAISASSQSSTWNSEALQKKVRPVTAKAPAGTTIRAEPAHPHLTNPKGASSRKDGFHDSSQSKEPKTTRDVPITSEGRLNLFIQMKVARDSYDRQKNIDQITTIGAGSTRTKGSTGPFSEEPNVTRGVPITSKGRQNVLIQIKAARGSYNSPQDVDQITNVRTNDSAGLSDRVPSSKKMEKTAPKTNSKDVANTRHRKMILKKLREERRKLEIARLCAEAEARVARKEENEKRIKNDYEGLLSFFTQGTKHDEQDRNPEETNRKLKDKSDSLPSAKLENNNGRKAFGLPQVLGKRNDFKVPAIKGNENLLLAKDAQHLKAAEVKLDGKRENISNVRLGSTKSYFTKVVQENITAANDYFFDEVKPSPTKIEEMYEIPHVVTFDTRLVGAAEIAILRTLPHQTRPHTDLRKTNINERDPPPPNVSRAERAMAIKSSKVKIGSKIVKPVARYPIKSNRAPISPNTKFGGIANDNGLRRKADEKQEEFEQSFYTTSSEQDDYFDSYSCSYTESGDDDEFSFRGFFSDRLRQFSSRLIRFAGSQNR